jgi:hypothetical protein
MATLNKPAHRKQHQGPAANKYEAHDDLRIL